MMRAYSAPVRRSGRPPGRRGATTVEFAVVSLAFFTLIAGLVELGRGLMSNYLLTNAARQACRVGIVPSASSNDVTAAANDALARGGITGATVTVAVNGAPADVSTAQSGDRITVTIQVPAASVTWLPVTRYLKGSLRGQYTLRRE
jgi:Flp pilus assembly protein TadG